RLILPIPCCKRKPSMSQQWMQCLVVTSLVAMALGWSSGRLAEAHSSDDLDQDNHQREKTLYSWAGDQARMRPAFLAVIDFDQRSQLEHYRRLLALARRGFLGHADGISDRRCPRPSSRVRS